MATNYFTGATVDVALSDNSGNAVLVRCATSAIPSSVAGYAVGCLLQATDDGGIFANTGSASSCTFVELAPVA